MKPGRSSRVTPCLPSMSHCCEWTLCTGPSVLCTSLTWPHPTAFRSYVNEVLECVFELPTIKRTFITSINLRCHMRMPLNSPSQNKSFRSQIIYSYRTVLCSLFCSPYRIMIWCLLWPQCSSRCKTSVYHSQCIYSWPGWEWYRKVLHVQTSVIKEQTSCGISKYVILMWNECI